MTAHPDFSPTQWNNIGEMVDSLEWLVKNEGEQVKVERWHGVPTAGKPDLVSVECSNVVCQANMNYSLEQLRAVIKPNLPWADEHFEERVSGIPYNPPPSHERWPYTVGNNAQFMPEGQFHHTYPERFWPQAMEGIRYYAGDLRDVVSLLLRDPLTRQAWLPVWFPEDTGVRDPERRVPCTLGYHFMRRNDSLHMWYIIRSCDIIRYLRDDIYMAIRLADWVLKELTDGDPLGWGRVNLGDFTFMCFSLHMFEGDRYVTR